MKKPKTILIWLILLCMALLDPDAMGNTADRFPAASVSSENSTFLTPLTCQPCFAFHDLNTKIRDGSIDKAEAVVQFQTVMAELASYARQNGFTKAVSPGCVFPLKGYNSTSIGGKNGSGYVERGYDYFDGNNHKGHPAQDLFILDHNQDSLDDATRRPVFVLAMEEGLVVSVEPLWEKGSRLRGGRYIWLYNPREDVLTYYAHNEKILVRLGEWVTPGQPIATVGRTGVNAAQKRSPTHLHLMHLKIISGLPRPVNRFKPLHVCRAR